VVICRPTAIINNILVLPFMFTETVNSFLP
jgi:hypothetical protein